MSTAQSYRDLFHGPNVSDKLNLFQSLLDSRDLTSDQADALLTVIRRELEQPQQHRSFAYRQYAQVMESFHRQMPEVYEQITSSWQQGRQRASRPGSVETRELEEGLEEPRAELDVPVNQVAERAQPQEAIAGEPGEKEEMHAEPEEMEEETEKEETEREVALEEEGQERSEQGEDKEEVEEEPGERGEGDEQEREEEDMGGEEPEAKEETGDAEPEENEPTEVEPESVEEAEVEADETLESSAAEPESQAESDHMATEAAEAAEVSEHLGMELEEAEPPEATEEEEPPIAGGE